MNQVGGHAVGRRTTFPVAKALRVRHNCGSMIVEAVWASVERRDYPLVRNICTAESLAGLWIYHTISQGGSNRGPRSSLLAGLPWWGGRGRGVFHQPESDLKP